MAFQDLKARIIQALRIISGDASVTEISVGVKLAYDPGIAPDNDQVLVPKWYVDTLSGGFVYFTDNDNPGISVDLGTGVVTLSDILTDFPTIGGNGMVRLQADQLIGSDWVSGDFVPDYGSITKDVDDNILTATFTLGNTSITRLRGRIY